VGLKAGRELPADGRGMVAQAMYRQFILQTDPLRKAKIIRAMGDRLDEASIAASLPMISTLAQGKIYPESPPPAEGTEAPALDVAIRVAAIDALANIGDASVVGILIDAANQTDTKAVADAAGKTLAVLPGEEVDKAISALLDGDNPAVKVIALGLIAERRIFSAAPTLLKMLNDSDESVSKAAASALGEISDIADLPVLLDMLRAAEAEADIQKILVVLKSACTRFSQDAAALGVAQALEAENTSTALKTHLLDLLKEIAGNKSLDLVNGFAWGTDAEMRNVATRVLGEWRSPSDLDRLAESCLKLAKESEEYKIRGLRGYIRLARQFAMPDDRRLSMCKEVFDLADRDEDRALIFDVFARVVSIKSLEQAASYLDHATLKDRAAETAVSIGEKLQGKNPATAAAMKKVLEVSGNDTIKERAQRVLDKQ
jgi:HEAT repeat protein